MYAIVCVIKFHRWGFQIGRLHVTWLDLWTRERGLWFEWDSDWDSDPSQATVDRWEAEAERLTSEALSKAQRAARSPS